MHQTEQQKTKNRCHKRIKSTAHHADQRAKNHNRHAPNRVRQLAAERATDARRQGEKCDDVTLIIRTAESRQVVGQFRNEHLKTGRKEEITQTEE